MRSRILLSLLFLFGIFALLFALCRPDKAIAQGQVLGFKGNMLDISEDGPILRSSCKLIQIGKRNITVISDSDGKQKTYRINQKTQIMDAKGHKITITNLKQGEQVVVTTAVDSDLAKSIKKGPYVHEIPAETLLK